MSLYTPKVIKSYVTLLNFLKDIQVLISNPEQKEVLNKTIEEYIA